MSEGSSEIEGSALRQILDAEKRQKEEFKRQSEERKERAWERIKKKAQSRITPSQITPAEPETNPVTATAKETSPTPEREKQKLMLRREDSTPISVVIGQEDPTLARRREITGGTVSTNIYLTEPLPLNAIVKLPIDEGLTLYFKKSASMDNNYPNSEWVEPVYMNEEDFQKEVQEKKIPTFTLETLPLDDETRKKIEDVSTNEQEEDKVSKPKTPEAPEPQKVQEEEPESNFQELARKAREHIKEGDIEGAEKLIANLRNRV